MDDIDIQILQESDADEVESWSIISDHPTDEDTLDFDILKELFEQNVEDKSSKTKIDIGYKKLPQTKTASNTEINLNVNEESVESIVSSDVQIEQTDKIFKDINSNLTISPRNLIEKNLPEEEHTIESEERTSTPNTDNIIPIITGVSLGTLLTVCGLSLIFLNSSTTAVPNKNDKILSLKDSLVNVLQKDSTWRNSVCSLFNEEHLLNTYCKNRRNKNEFMTRKRKRPKSHMTERRMKRLVRDLCARPNSKQTKKKLNTSGIPKVCSNNVLNIGNNDKPSPNIYADEESMFIGPLSKEISHKKHEAKTENLECINKVNIPKSNSVDHIEHGKPLKDSNNKCHFTNGGVIRYLKPNYICQPNENNENISTNDHKVKAKTQKISEKKKIVPKSTKTSTDKILRKNSKTVDSSLIEKDSKDYLLYIDFHSKNIVDILQDKIVELSEEVNSFNVKIGRQQKIVDKQKLILDSMKEYSSKREELIDILGDRLQEVQFFNYVNKDKKRNSSFVPVENLEKVDSVESEFEFDHTPFPKRKSRYGTFDVEEMHKMSKANNLTHFLKKKIRAENNPVTHSVTADKKNKKEKIVLNTK